MAELESNQKKNVRYGESIRKDKPFKLLNQPQWKKDDFKSTSPRPLTVTNISQDYQLREIDDIVVSDESKHSSVEWIRHKKINQVTLDQLVKLTHPIIPQNQEDDIHDQICFYKITESDFYRFESELLWYQNIIEERIDWLCHGSRKKFGVIKGDQVCVLVDVSTQNCSFERLDVLKDDLKILKDDQLSEKTKLYLSSYGSQVNNCWTSNQILNNNHMLQDIDNWIENLQPSGNNSLLNALKSVFKTKKIDSLTIIIGTDPAQHFDVVTDYLTELLSGCSLDVLLVAYNCKLPSTKMFLEDLSTAIDCRFHSYTSPTEDSDAEIQSSDISYLKSEYKRLVNVAEQVFQLKQGNKVKKMKLIINQKMNTSNALVKVESSLLSRVDQKYCSNFLNLNVEKPSIRYRSSKDWLKKYGLRAKGLSLYQVMAPNAFSYVDSYVAVLNKNVISKNHNQVMEQMAWKDGSIKNVHIDPVLLKNYQFYLRETLHVYKKRLAWLVEQSRRSIGVIKEENIVIVLDMCAENSQYLSEIQWQVKNVLEQQMTSRKLFNLICVGKRVTSFSKTMVKPTKENLMLCWSWLLNETCDGERKVLTALQYVFENYEEKNGNLDVNGVYLLFCGAPIESQDVIGSFIEENVIGTNTSVNCVFMQMISPHTSTFEINLSVKYWKSIAELCEGSFHWTNSQEPIESDDMRLINEEMEKAHNYYGKAEMLLSKIKSKEQNKLMIPKEKHLKREKGKKRREGRLSITLPRQTALSKARIQLVRPQSATLNIKKAQPITNQRPQSAVHYGDCKQTNNFSTVKPSKDKSLHEEKLMKKTCVIHPEKPAVHTFYTEVGNQTGSILTNFRSSTPSITNNTPQKIIASMKINIPNSEEQCSTMSWLKKFSLSRLKLNIERITSVCGHSNKSAGKPKYCNIFPSENINGSLRHLHLNLKELSTYGEYLEIVMARYMKRLTWLNNGSRRVFGTLIENKVILIIDTSGSMVNHLENLKRDLISLLWEQIYHNKKMFNIILFSSDVRCFSHLHFMEPTKENCAEAVCWVENITCGGETATLEALTIAFQCSEDGFGVYLLTDGKPNSSTGLVLREANRLTSCRKIKIHTISFNCGDSVANLFLRNLAHETKGRYHQYAERHDPNNNIETDSHSDINEGKNSWRDDSQQSDDVIRLVKEIDTVEKYLNIVESFKNILDRKTMHEDLSHAK